MIKKCINFLKNNCSNGVRAACQAVCASDKPIPAVVSPARSVGWSLAWPVCVHTVSVCLEPLPSSCNGYHGMVL